MAAKAKGPYYGALSVNDGESGGGPLGEGGRLPGRLDGMRGSECGEAVALGDTRRDCGLERECDSPE